MEAKRILKILIIICIILIIIDQSSKILIKNYMDDDINIISDFIVITKLENEGMAFGINKKNIGNIIITTILLIAIIKYIFNQKENMNKKIVFFLSLIIAGGCSNLIDRIFKGAVFDFIKIGSFPVFNLADCFIVIGWFCFVINFIIFSAKEIRIDKI